MSFGIPVRNGLAVGLLASTFLSSLRIGGRPAMFLNFIGTDSLDSRVTFTRATTATFVGSNGLIQTAAINAPRLDYNPATLAPRGLLIEEQRANLFIQSQFQSNWTANAVTTTFLGTYVTSPDGTSNGRILNDTSAAAAAYVFQGVSFTNAATYTLSVYVKKGVSRYFALNSFTQSGRALFDLNNYSLSSVTGIVTSATITAVGGGWYRCTATMTASATGTNNLGFGDFEAGPTGDLYYLWGAQIEAGTFVTSYIPTVAATVTRSADVATMTGTNFSSWFNATEGTFTFSGDSAYGSGGLIGSTPTTGAILYANTNAPRTFNGTNFVGTANTYTNNAVFSTALGYSASGRSIVLNGGTVATDVNLIQTPTAITLGGAFGGGYLNGHIRAINYYNTRLPNTTLRTLTS